MGELKQLEQMFKNGRITRREFITRMSALGLGAALSPALFSTPVLADAPKKGGRLRLGSTGGSTSDSLDPAKLAAMMQWNISWQTRNNLVEIDHNTEPQPELAESWESSPDATQWMFQLRKGVEFHNGKTLDAEDVLFSINRHRTEESQSAAKGVLKPITEIKADGKDKVIFTLEEGSADFPFLLSDYHLTITPNGTTEFEDSMGTGGYILEKFEPGVRAFAKRNPNYFKTDKAFFDEVETISIPDVNARTNALKTGEIDVMDRCEKKTFHLLKRSPGVQVITTTGFKHYTFAMLCDRKPYDNNDARLALKYAFDREHFLKQILRGYGVVGNDHPIAPANRYHNTDLPQRVYDPDKAKFHLKKAGLEGHTFDIHVADIGFPGSVDAAVLYKEHAKKAGIEINIVREPEDGYWSEVWMKEDWCAVYWGGRPTEDWMFSTSYADGAPWNDSHWKNVRFNELLKAARAELDEEKRRGMYYEMQQIVRNDGGVMVLAFASDLMAASEKIRYGELAANWELDGMKCAERWWFA